MSTPPALREVGTQVLQAYQSVSGKIFAVHGVYFVLLHLHGDDRPVLPLFDTTAHLEHMLGACKSKWDGTQVIANGSLFLTDVWETHPHVQVITDLRFCDDMVRYKLLAPMPEAIDE